MAEKITLLVPYAIAAVLWVLLWWHTITKIGYRGLARKLWLVGMCIPPFLSVVLVCLLVLPWPVLRQLRQLRKQNSLPEDEIEAELRSLRENL